MVSARLVHVGGALLCNVPGNPHQVVFKSQTYVDLFLKTLGEMWVRNVVLIHAYSLMTKHYQMLEDMPRATWTVR